MPNIHEELKSWFSYYNSNFNKFYFIRIVIFLWNAEKFSENISDLIPNILCQHEGGAA